ncbi:MAG: hypothetical protein IPH94_20620 [Saprospiraceae bacterium]|nr:hypothetical protein [Saprospiraceae bacterium]MBK7223615.1 hypothetical protein [Saprospiraceae bacterium]MBK7787762.1 hypothetical protein [Saprospiraceae bacterium]MBK8109182.1 hypothetical protein [Saprospiraceae bacterium]MBK8850067.1 hypothetical protein [Saprospiraceae bacterium]
MYNFFAKNGTTVAMLTALAVTLIFIISAVTGMSSDGYAVGTDLAGMGKEKVAQMGYFDIGLSLTIFLLVSSLILLVIFGVWTLIKFPKALKSTIIFSGLLLGLFFALYATATKESTGKLGRALEEFQISDSVNSFVTAGLWSMIIMSLGAVLIMVAMEVRNMFK